ncbi:G-type lectin S-receptor-like serine/threonine-protein kinase At4g27290 [Cynara cardunculus var. scolymus]|uniref:G-type lectin S-receptor-like serine/threonine-protein kinase At4g27290 n=1 Tax=Cynara cardunculus var. scolymus TaxID=59895 RepID=UPI000D62B3AC|nr:G-type lectin S-receptor-like serine/threonine-protein kinase At4g27290 [Cynara cardunculus var. scolymus]
MEPPFLFLIPFLFSFYALFTSSMAANTIAVNQTITDGQTIVSPQQSFELGFFSPTTTTHNRYLGIWYKRLATDTVAWVANRETPIANKSGELTLHPNGVLVLRDSTTNRTIWSSGSTRTSPNPIAQLLDSGNLMVLDQEGGNDDPEDYIWQSFDQPGNTYLPGIKFGRNLQKGVVTNFTSWKTDDDPSEGEHMVYMDFNGLPQIYQNKGDVIHMRLGSWNGLSHTGMPTLKPNPIFTFEQVSNDREIYYKFELINSSNLIKMMLTTNGDLVRLNWVNRSQEWSLFSTPEVDKCSQYAVCGPYASCNTEQFPVCGCLKGFVPKNPQQWDAADWTSGCRWEIPLDCGVGEGFRRYPLMKLPDTRKSWFDRKMSLEQCRIKCKNECNCSAYSALDILVNIGCILWYDVDELIDIRSFPNIGQDIYIRMTAVELEKDKKTSSGNKKAKIIVISIMVGSTVLLGLLVLMIIRKRKEKRQERHDPVAKDKEESQIYESRKDNLHDLPLFSLSTLFKATDNFSDSNKIGEGGFGPVYKGFLEDGREIAVKRLSESSTQGVDEFKNEVLFISKLQHRNLVKILGCCIEGQEKTLVYEYMPNKGLDLFLFQEDKRKTLNWTQRFHIINGIARGLLYLHQDSRLRIIHRDLKASNILLDHEMNPKISDFGMARSFRGNDTETKTKRVVGTYGYMSPEYAGNGIFSVKSDVFSFGVLVLEIVSGKKSRGFFHMTHNDNLLGHAWRLYNEGNILELVEASLIESNCTFEMLRSIHVGLLCVQNNPDDRPTMSTVIMMMSSDGPLPEPKQPGFYIENGKFQPGNSSSMQTQESNGDITITVLEPR